VKRAATGPSTNTLRDKLETANGVLFVELSGALDENSDLQELFARLSGDAVLNMRNVERVNSMGVHGWIPLMTRLSEQHRVVVDDISYALVQNANAVANMFGSAQVRSCMAPYFCATCSDNVTVPVLAAEVAAAGQSPPIKLCARCQSPMDFDELDGYFEFFKTRGVK